MDKVIVAIILLLFAIIGAGVYIYISKTKPTLTIVSSAFTTTAAPRQSVISTVLLPTVAPSNLVQTTTATPSVFTPSNSVPTNTAIPTTNSPYTTTTAVPTTNPPPKTTIRPTVPPTTTPKGCVGGDYTTYKVLKSVKLIPGEQLPMCSAIPDNLIKPNHFIALQSDGNLVVYSYGKSTWTSNTSNSGIAPYTLKYSLAGNLAIYDATNAIQWQTNTSKPGYATMNTSGDFQVFDNSGIQLWHTDSAVIQQCIGSDFSKYSPYPDTGFNGIGSINSCTAIADVVGNPSPAHFLALQSDGDLVLFSNKVAVWHSNTANKGVAPYNLRYQSDGNLILSDSNGASIWSSGVFGQSLGNFTVQTDGNVVVYDGSGKVAWASGATANTTDNCKIANDNSPYFQGLLANLNWSGDDTKNVRNNLSAWGYGDGKLNLYNNVMLQDALKRCNGVKPPPALPNGDCKNTLNTVPYFNWLVNNVENWTEFDKNAVISALGQFGFGNLGTYSKAYLLYVLTSCGNLKPPVTQPTMTCRDSLENTAYWNWIMWTSGSWTDTDKANVINALSYWGYGDGKLNTYRNDQLLNGIFNCRGPY